MKFSGIISVALGLVAGRFVYQAFTGHNWDVATERSFFSTGALLTLWLVARVTR